MGLALRIPGMLRSAVWVPTQIAIGTCASFLDHCARLEGNIGIPAFHELRFGMGAGRRAHMPLLPRWTTSVHGKPSSSRASTLFCGFAECLRQ